jgi:uncharacterized protein YndB with AHSA1/START domain
MTLDREFTLRRTIPASPAEVFAAWTDAGQLDWFFSGEGSPGRPEVDLRVGGAWRQVMVIDDDEQYVTGGIYREIVPGERLVFTWGAEGGWPEPNEDAPVVTLTFAPAEAGTEMALTHSFPEHLSEERVREQLATGMRAGWGMTIDRLVKRFGGVTPQSR